MGLQRAEMTTDTLDPTDAVHTLMAQKARIEEQIRAYTEVLESVPLEQQVWLT